MNPTVDEVRRALLPVLEAAPVKLGVLFGSVAGGRAGSDSRVRVAILPEHGDLTSVEERRLTDALASACGRAVNIVRLDQADELLRWQVAREGVVLLSRPAEVGTRFLAEGASVEAELAEAAQWATHSNLLARLRLANGDEPPARSAASREALGKDLERLREHVQRARRRWPKDIAAFLDDAERLDAIALAFVVATSIAVNVAFRVSGDEAWGVRTSHRDAIDLMSRHGVLDDALARSMRDVVALKHRVTRGATIVEPVLLWQDLPPGLAALDRYASAFDRYLASLATPRTT